MATLFLQSATGMAVLAMTLLLGLVEAATDRSVYNCNTAVVSTGVADLRTFAINDELSLCAHFLPQDVKIAFTVKVDTYQALTMRRTFEALNSFNTDLMFQTSNSWTKSRQVVT